MTEADLKDKVHYLAASLYYASWQDLLEALPVALVYHGAAEVGAHVQWLMREPVPCRLSVCVVVKLWGNSHAVVLGTYAQQLREEMLGAGQIARSAAENPEALTRLAVRAVLDHYRNRPAQLVNDAVVDLDDPRIAPTDTPEPLTEG